MSIELPFGVLKYGIECPHVIANCVRVQFAGLPQMKVQNRLSAEGDPFRIVMSTNAAAWPSSERIFLNVSGLSVFNFQIARISLKLTRLIRWFCLSCQ